MKSHHPRGARRAADVSLPALLVENARPVIEVERERRWKGDNPQAIEDYNRWIEVNGLPLAEYRQF